MNVRKTIHEQKMKIAEKLRCLLKNGRRKMDFKRIIMTCAGRERYLEILAMYLERDFQKDCFDEWHICLNTFDENDIDFIRELGDKYFWVKIIELDEYDRSHFSRNIYKFHKFAVDPEAIYLRLDDDIVFVDEGAIASMFEFRVKNPEYFMIFGNIINNAICGHLHQRFGINGYKNGFNCYECMDTVGWNNSEYAKEVHYKFLNILEHYRTLDLYKFPRWELWDFERFSINACCWFGKDWAEFGGEVDMDEEPYIASVLPRKLNRICCINGDAVFSHFAFYTQRDFLDKTDILDRYHHVAKLKSYR